MTTTKKTAQAVADYVRGREEGHRGERTRKVGSRAYRDGLRIGHFQTVRELLYPR